MSRTTLRPPFLRRAVVFGGIAVLLIGAGAVGLAVNTSPGRQPDVTAGTPLDVLERDLRSQGTPDAVIATFEHGSITDSRTIGSARYDTETPFYVGSASKSLAAATVARLVQQDRLGFDDTVVSHLPWFRTQGAYEAITVRHLLNQTSGLPQWAGMVDVARPETGLEQRVRDVRSVPLTSEPGQAFQYCNKNFAILAMVIESVTGQPYADVLRSEVLDPLELTQTVTHSGGVPDGELADGSLLMFGAHVPWPTPDFPGALADGYVISTARDLAAFADAMATGRYEGEQFLSTAVLHDVQTPPPNVAPDPTYGSTYGMGVRVSNLDGRKAVWHEGELATFHANFGVFPDHRTGVVVLTNHNNQLIDADVAFLAGMSASAGITPQPSDGGYWWVAFSMITVAALLLTAMIADLARWRVIARRTRSWRLRRQVIPRAVIGILLGAGTFYGLGWMFELPGPLPVPIAWTGAPDLTLLVLGTTTYLIVSATVLVVPNGDRSTSAAGT